MNPSPLNIRQVVILFGVFGFVFGWYFPFAITHWMFYTTKPDAFINDWVVFVSAALFGASFAMIPFSTIFVPGPFAKIRNLKMLLARSGVWAVMTVLTSIVVRIVTAAIHHKMLDIHAWLLRSGLFLVPILAGSIVFLVGFWSTRRTKAGL